MDELIFLKLGGSLITDKTVEYTARLEKIESLAKQIANALASQKIKLIIGHGSGSFGHTAGKQHNTRAGILGDPKKYWRGFAKVWYQASSLNRIVINSLHNAGIACVGFSPASSVIADNGKIISWDINPLRASLEGGLVPVICGDTVFDKSLGGTILSTEDLFVHLAGQLHPKRILLAGIDPVWEDFPARTKMVARITPASFNEIKRGVVASGAVDVTGGMQSKVQEMLALVERDSNLSVQIFSGEEDGNIERTVHGEVIGTIISAD